MTYIRHRARMVQESVAQDLRDTLIATRWLVGTTGHDVIIPGATEYTPATCTLQTVFPLAKGKPVTLVDYFPEAQGERDSRETVPENTFALDNGRPGDASPIELGTNDLEQPYLFNMAFWAISDAVADAVLSDLKDRYEGRIVRNESIALYDWNADTATPAGYLEIDSFRYSRDLENAAPAEVHLFFGELTLTDYVEE